MNKKIIVNVDQGLAEFIPGYLKDISQWTKNILEAVDESDFDTVRTLSHKMIGTGSGYGFDFITDAGKQSNKAAHSSDSASVREWIHKLENYLSHIEINYIKDEFDLED